jgi:hypothetical protein
MGLPGGEGLSCCLISALTAANAYDKKEYIKSEWLHGIF